MKTLRVVSHQLLNALLILTLVVAPFGLTGCTSSQVQDTLNVAAQVASSSAGIVAPISPEYGALIGAAGATLKDISALYSAYTSAAAADKPGIAGKLHALLGTLTANLRTILADAHVKAPALVQEIGVAVAIINSAVTLVLAHLPQSAVSPAVRANAQALPVISKAKSAADLANAWNNAVGAQHPEAVVNAPKHGKRILGVPVP